MKNILEIVKKFDWQIELLIVVCTAFGYFIYGSMTAFLTHGSTDYTEIKFLQLVMYEAFVFFLLKAFLMLRGWQFQSFRSAFNAPSILTGIGLAALVHLSWIFFWNIIVAIYPIHIVIAENGPLTVRTLSIWTVIAVSIVNPVFEEFFLCSYLITLLEKKKGIWFAVNFSMLIRLTYHLYQGVQAIALIPCGLILSLYFVRTKRIWPVVVAHSILDYVALAQYSQ